ETVERLIGMFAMSFWDRRERRLVLVRDRLGIKPLYWTDAGGAFLFGSELKAFREFSGWTPELDRAALAAYLRFGYVPAPHSIYRGVRKLEPGRILTLGPEGEPEIRAYWSLAEIAAQGQRHRFAGTEAEAAEMLDQLLGDAVRRRMVADVP